MVKSTLKNLKFAKIKINRETPTKFIHVPISQIAAKQLLKDTKFTKTTSFSKTNTSNINSNTIKLLETCFWCCL